MLKKKLYFLVAKYFQFWAKMVLKKWNPFIIAVVGSAGKTSTLYLISHVLGEKKKIKVSHKTNAVTSIALDILGLKQISFSVFEWVKLFLVAPFRIFIKYEEDLYLCEMDSDRTDEMKTHTDLIKPDICCIPSLYATHTENFEGKNRDEILDKVSYDFGFAIAATKKIVIANAESKLLEKELKRSRVLVWFISSGKNKDSILKLSKHEMSLSGTKMEFEINQNVIPVEAGIYKNSRFPMSAFSRLENDTNKIEVNFPYALMSEINSYSVGMAILVGLNFGMNITEIVEKLKTWRLPPGRMSIFVGRRTTTIIDSSYNSSRKATIDALKVLSKIGGEKTVAVLGDMRELGKLTKSEHEKVAEEIVKQKIRRVILVGPAMSEFVYPKLIENGYRQNRTVFKTLEPKWALDLIVSEDFLRNGETILVKGSQNTLFLEEIVERLLVSKKDVAKLCRREKLWEYKRKMIYKN